MDKSKEMVAELHFDNGNTREETKRDVEIWLTSLDNSKNDRMKVPTR